MIRILFILLFTVISSNLSFAQESKSYDYHPPLKIPLILSANFGELRPNHFHMGVDFKTQGKEGFNLYSIDEGYVSRIKVSPYGYGKVVYIDHPNGITSVYAHCSEFKGKVDSIVKATQYATENYEVEVFPSKNEIQLTKGEVFAISGNSGSSTAPHLHFELRDTETEACLNPLVFGFDIADSRSPEIRKVKAYGLTHEGFLIPGKEKLQTVNKSTDYYITGNKLILPSSFASEKGGVGLAFDIIDRLDGANNQCGLYGTFLIADGDTIFGQKTDRISFDHTRYINSHKDYDAYRASKYKLHKSFRNAYNPLEIYINNELGIIPILPGESKEIVLIAYDPKGNKSKIEFTLQIIEGEINNFEFDDNYIFPKDSIIINHADYEIHASPFTLYEPFKRTKVNHAEYCAGSQPIQNAVEIKLKNTFPDSIAVHHYITAISNGRTYPLETTIEDGWFIAYSKYPGKYELRKDTNPPAVRGISYNSSYNISGSTIKLSVTENETGILDYDLFIDEKWHPIEFENKGDYLMFKRPDGIKGTHSIKIIVEDGAHNKCVYERQLNFL